MKIDCKKAGKLLDAAEVPTDGRLIYDGEKIIDGDSGEVITMKIPKENLQDYQRKLTQDQSAKLLKKMAWCNACDALDIFCTKNNYGYCRECIKEVME